MSKNNHAPKKYRVVYGYESLAGVVFVLAKDDVEASRSVKDEMKKAYGHDFIIYSVSEDTRFP